MQVEKELQEICLSILDLLDNHLIPSASTGESKVFYYKMKGDYHRYLAEFKTQEQREESAKHTLEAYKKAQVCACQFLEPRQGAVQRCERTSGRRPRVSIPAGNHRFGVGEGSQCSLRKSLAGSGHVVARGPIGRLLWNDVTEQLSDDWLLRHPNFTNLYNFSACGQLRVCLLAWMWFSPAGEGFGCALTFSDVSLALIVSLIFVICREFDSCQS